MDLRKKYYTHVGLRLTRSGIFHMTFIGRCPYIWYSKECPLYRGLLGTFSYVIGAEGAQNIMRHIIARDIMRDGNTSDEVMGIGFSWETK